ncbi:MAG TPA: primosomal protein N' [Patescibacteria group bacterium]|nr:primosomal protein N' [Patescibacteria group bacterium]
MTPVAPTLGLAVPASEPAGDRLVEVAVDAPGAGRRRYTYALPDRLADVEDGEAILVEFGRRQALGVVLGPAGSVPGVTPKPIVDRVRADGPLLPGLSLALAAWIADTYLAPPATVVRAMLPPGILERLELVAERRPDVEPTTEPADRAVLDQLADGPRAVRDLAAPEGRAGLLRRLRALAAAGRLDLDWTLLAATGGPRYERWVRPSTTGSAVAASIAAGGRPAGRPLGPRQLELMADLAAGPIEGQPAAGLAGRHGTSALAGLVRRDLATVEIRERPRRPLGSRPVGARGGRPVTADLTGPQAEAVAAIRTALTTRDPTPLLIDGVTGGGKTAVYAEAIAASLALGRRALVLVPEIALAMPLVDRLRADLDAQVALVHSAVGAGERTDEWRRIRSGAVDIVVGTRLAVLAPLAEVGLIVVDEEHESTYKSDRTPRLQARDTAIALGRLAGAAVVLGSATPAVDSVGRARSGTYRRVLLPDRPSGLPPTVEVVDLRAELAAGNRGLLSDRLVGALRALDPAAGDRAILVINRRGTASIVLCRDCGHVQACPECERPLVYHAAGGSLRCHQCGTAAPMASRCPACRSPRIRYLGGGTERVEREVRDRFPELRVGRLDRDVVERKGAAERVIDGFRDGRIDILVGTSLVAKGLDIPEVTVVGVVSADVALNLPDERAAERTFQLLAQAVGRAGRGDRPGRALIQSYQPDHPAIQAVASGDADAFYDAELEVRRRFGSPPFGRLVKLTLGLEDAAAAERTANAEADRLRALASERGGAVAVIGPAPAFIRRRAGRWRWNVILRGADPVGLLGDGPEAPWSVDVDPETLL